MSDVRQDQQGMTASGGEGQSSGQERGASKNVMSVWEWIVAAIGLVLVLGSISFLVYEAVTAKKTIDVRIQVESVEPIGNGYLVKFKALNHGGVTLAHVMVEAVLQQGTEKVETSQVTLDYLPGNSNRKGGFFFTKDPRRYTIQARATGYQLP